MNPLTVPNREEPNILPENITVSGAVIANVKPYANAKIIMLDVSFDNIINAKINILMMKHIIVGRDAP